MNKNTPTVAIPRNAREALLTLYSYPSPIILTSLLVALIGFRLYLGNWQWSELIAPAVLLVGWPLLEWCIHVFLLHYRPKTAFGREWDFALPQKHRRHHKEPWDLDNIFIHLPVFPVAVPALALLAYGLMPSLEAAITALLAFFILALNYEFTHFLGHIHWCPPLSYYQRRVRQHRLHHFRHEQKWWGVSMGLGDVILGTAPNEDSAERSDFTADILAAHQARQS